MECPYDNGHVRITNSYPVSNSLRTQRGVCEVCARRFTIQAEMVEQTPGGSAKAVARRLRGRGPSSFVADDGESG